MEHRLPHLRTVLWMLVAVVLGLHASWTSAQTGDAHAQSVRANEDGDRPAARIEPEAPKPGARRLGVSTRLGDQINAREAARRLAQARRHHRESLQLLTREGEGSAGAASVNDRYWQRQEKLRLAVEDAERRSNETSALLLIK